MSGQEEQTIQSRDKTANEFTNVKDIKKIYLYSKDGYIFSYLRIHFLNLDLLPTEEKKSKAAALAASFESDRKDFVYTAYPREIDLDKYKNEIKQRYREEDHNLGKKHILQEMLLEATDLATNGENYEHQHFIKIWKKVSTNKQDAEVEVKNRIEEMKSRYTNIGITAEILQAQDIIKMCNLYGNGLQASYEVTNNNFVYESITQLK